MSAMTFSNSFAPHRKAYYRVTRLAGRRGEGKYYISSPKTINFEIREVRLNVG